MPGLLRVAMLLIATLWFAWHPQAARAEVSETALAGSAGGAAVRDVCPPGFVMTGVGYGGDTDIVFIAGFCQHFTEGQTDSSESGLERFGNRPPELSAGKLSCPANTAVGGMFVGVSAVGTVHDISLRCRNPLGREFTTSSVTQIPGGEANRHQFIGCGSDAMAVGMVGRSGDSINALGLVCQAIAAGPVSPPAPQPNQAQTEPPPLTPIPAQPLPAAAGDLNRPPLGIDNTLFTGGGGTPTHRIGGGDGDEFTASCGQGYALVGWGYNATSVLTAVVPVCQRVVDGQLLGRHGEVAQSALGTEATGAMSGPAIFCPDDAAVRALSVFLTSDLRVHHIRGTCYAPAGGQAPTLIRPTLTAGGTAPAQRGVSCSPTFAIGLTGTSSPSRGGAITSLGLVCNDPGATPANTGD
jgi:hypothetical protein